MIQKKKNSSIPSEIRKITNIVKELRDILNEKDLRLILI